MNKTTISHHIGGMATLALLFFSNAAFADDSENLPLCETAGIASRVSRYF